MLRFVTLSALLPALAVAQLKCPSNAPLSCPSPSGVNSCCTESPGGYFQQTQFWDYSPATGPSNSWTVHGLWPDNCDGTYDANCDPNRAYTNITAILKAGGAQTTLDYMNVYWKDYQGNDESFWEHEWAKHGTCISTLKPSCYGSSYTPQEEVVDFFETTVSLFKTLPTYTWLTNEGITPSTTKTYSLAQLQAVANKYFGYNAVWNCQNGNLNEVWWGHYVKGPVRSGTFVPTSPVGSGSTCPSTGIKWQPKSSGTGTTTTTTSPPSSTSTSAPGTKSYLNVINSSSSTQGCLISSGKWMVGATCAGFTSASSGSGFTLTSSKGICSIVSGQLSCASGQSATVFNQDSNGNLIYSGSNTFYSTSVPSGTTQNSVFANSNSVAIKLRISSTSA